MMNTRKKLQINSEKTQLIDNKAHYKNIVSLINTGKIITKKVDFKNACINDLNNARQIHAALKNISEIIMDVDSIYLPNLLKICERKSKEDVPSNSYLANWFSCWCRPKKEESEVESDIEDDIQRPDSPVSASLPKRKDSYESLTDSSDDEYQDTRAGSSNSPSSVTR